MKIITHKYLTYTLTISLYYFWLKKFTEVSNSLSLFCVCFLGFTNEILIWSHKFFTYFTYWLAHLRATSLPFNEKNIALKLPKIISTCIHYCSIWKWKYILCISGNCHILFCIFIFKICYQPLNKII